MTDDNVMELELTTTASAPKMFTVDGDPYQMFTYEHLNKEQEAHVQALFRRHTREMNKLDSAMDDRTAETVAAKNRETRIDILCALTDVPREVTELLPQPAQARLMREIGSQLRAEVYDEED